MTNNSHNPHPSNTLNQKIVPIQTITKEGPNNYLTTQSSKQIETTKSSPRTPKIYRQETLKPESKPQKQQTGGTEELAHTRGMTGGLVGAAEAGGGGGGGGAGGVGAGAGAEIGGGRSGQGGGGEAGEMVGAVGERGSRADVGVLAVGRHAFFFFPYNNTDKQQTGIWEKEEKS